MINKKRVCQVLGTPSLSIKRCVLRKINCFNLFGLAQGIYHTDSFCLTIF